MINRLLTSYSSAKLADISSQRGWLLLILSLFSLGLRAQYPIHYYPADKDSGFLVDVLKLQTNFQTVVDADQYIRHIPEILGKKGYGTASVDSVSIDTSVAAVFLFVGELYNWSEIKVDSADRSLLLQAGLNSASWRGRKFDMERLEIEKQQLLGFLENNGYPFARVELDSVFFAGSELTGKLKVTRGPLYKIDSVRNLGNARISSDYLQRYLGIPPGSVYKKQKLEAVSRRLSELPFLSEKQPWNMTLLGTGSVLNLYVEPKKSSQVNVLIGLLPSNQQLESNKLLVTGEANINLKNALGSGETIGLNWQQLQVKSPRLNLVYQHPYLFKSPVGLAFNFDLFKKDSSFVNINLMLGAQYSIDASQNGSVFIQSISSNLLTIDTMQVKQTRQLPPQADINSINLGFSYDIWTTDYRLNPRKGNEFSVTTSAGTKNVKKNAVIMGLVDESDPDFDFSTLYDTVKLKSYQFRIKAIGSHYFPLARVSTLKASVNAGWFGSENIFRNELFQIGGYKLLRGFDEESIYASAYAVGTAEYRYLMARNSFLFVFSDAGWVDNKMAKTSTAGVYIGLGGGMAFETKAGIFNISYAVGKRDDTNFNLRQSKIHLGYVNYF
ncbi:MAG TPA: BamA/TamA family outer membrane protein [Flavitalea sp.]|nr:BamA/TamA family outer membrane protein [Flavitalea sp.]